MASQGKKKASNIIVWIILALLIVGLMGFGAGNFGGTVRTAASVGDTEVEVTTYSRALQQRLQTLQTQTGQSLTLAEAQQMGIDGAVLTGLLNSAALDEAARKAGLSVGDDNVAEQIQQISSFQGVDGSFDREAYNFALQRNGMSAGDFEDTIRADLTRGLLQSALVSGALPSPVYANTIFDFIAEQRDFTYAEIDRADLDEAPTQPTADEVRAFYDANAEQFTLPERRKLTYAWLTPDMLIDEVELDETALRELYDSRIDEFQRPETVIAERLVFADDEAAAAAKAQLDAGETTFDALVEDRGLTLTDVDLDEITRDDLNTEAADAVFALGEPGIVGPTPTDLGPAIFRVNAVLAAQTTEFEDALPELRDELAMQRARRIIEADVETTDDMLAGGATLEDLAKETDMVLGTVEWTGNEHEGLAAYPEFAAIADTLTQDDFPEIRQLEDGGIYAVRLDEIVPPTLQSFEAVEADARDAATQQKLIDALTAKADEVTAQLGEGQTFEELGFDPVAKVDLTRRGFIEEVPEELLSRLFEIDAGDLVTVSGEDSVFVARLDSVRTPAANDPGREMMNQQLQGQVAQAVAQDILVQFSRAIQQSEGITVNQNALNAVHAQMQ
ncbi:peptidylprolyl isomerase [Qingshengfaniella alkalisoli]|uniref:Parvulin-like PPIase n=1 Tax=Qingshengfaniella alkalisoli TaxID=2599296 RepID=A0A5B8IWN5_9RHOB|nr:peptidylprolyl isomerase [Qingshengfaniella alkalisoli]QDY69241.1 peptidylprolyl isomerase [Qingshengfaniella alkalisoli]